MDSVQAGVVDSARAGVLYHGQAVVVDAAQPGVVDAAQPGVWMLHSWGCGCCTGCGSTYPGVFPAAAKYNKSTFKILNLCHRNNQTCQLGIGRTSENYIGGLLKRVYTICISTKTLKMDVWGGAHL